MAKHISVKGVVHGVGFRPFVYELATRLNLHGWVSNTSGGVEIVVEGQTDQLDEFLRLLSDETPPSVTIDSMQIDEVLSDTSMRFEIHDSNEVDSAYPAVSADLAICPDCERELFQPQNRRYLYPFISCNHCGPRFTIIKDIPYARSSTTMADYPLCEDCRAEYTDPASRHFHAQSIACPECGPFVELRETHSQFPTSDPRISSIEIRTSAILKARRLLREGYIVAVKGLGGFHLACDAANPYTVAELRDRKGRIDKPFAVMAADVSAVVSVCELSREEHLLLTGREKPIVILPRRKQSLLQTYKVSELVAPGLDTLGVMLPYTPLHHLLLNQTDPILAREPVPPILVMTSSNFSEEPIAIDNSDALQRLSPLADAFLLHHRKIHVRCDDSVVRVETGRVKYLRRSRGYAPYPVELPFETRPTLALGADLHNSFCLTRDRYAFLSHHIGDMNNVEAHAALKQGLEHLSNILRVQPEVVAHDLNPDFFTTRYSRSMPIQQVAVQHHHAHVAACMADNGLNDRRVIGLAFDGAGYGSDGAIWGGEILLASYTHLERFAHLEYMPLPGSESARSPWRVAVAYAHVLGLDVEKLSFLQNIDKHSLATLRQQMDSGQDIRRTSSVGRLFDVVSSLVGIRNEITYDAQAAIEMEVLSKPFMPIAKPYPYTISKTRDGAIIQLKELIVGIVQEMRTIEPVGKIAARFHKTMGEITIEVCRQARAASGLNEVVLSGGVWQNQILFDLVHDGLRQEDFVVYCHRHVPANDGGLALGQAVIANHVFALQNASAGGSRQSGL